jgi:hypothetical protein
MSGKLYREGNPLCDKIPLNQLLMTNPKIAIVKNISGKMGRNCAFWKAPNGIWKSTKKCHGFAANKGKLF